ncbi:hypothetical protein AYL99_09215 [Fonsecaea erecta]|uniref:Putative zinc-finger domain-containing protein n=1 Tax=Fonsecaea erecta TaxID=1367422 RepID=A0A178ZBR0_9EURO|nr:hypothetical protein AYL99_09215 [Fonsecaea erecta]OAP57102.1 hypothetical protein AYL99_09215 [Fonsecaea erecta]
MAHPYSSTPLYAGTPSYAPQQSYYPSFSSNGLQQPINTPPGIPQQVPPPQGQIQTHPAYQQQPSPAANGPRFDVNSQIRPPAPPFHPPFPPPTTTFNSDFFKQFASAGFPPPPPPNFPPVPIPGAAYPQLPGSVNTSTSSPYPQHVAAGAAVFGAGFVPNEQPRQQTEDQFNGAQPGSRGGMDVQTDTQTYGTVQGGISHPAHTFTKGRDRDKDQTLPSFGSRSDVDMLFASAQKQAMVGAVEQSMIASHPQDTNHATEPDSAADGNVSPYDPTRPAAINDRALGGFGSSSKPSKSANLRPVERSYDNKSLAELRQLAKGAVLSLVPHKILYPDLVKEGINPQILHELYEELGLRTELSQSQAREEVHGEQHPLVGGNVSSTASQPPASSQPKAELQKDTPTVSTAQAISQSSMILPSSTTLGLSGSSEVIAQPAIVDTRNQQSVPSPSLERKDRIAQLLAAKTGRPTPNPTSSTLSQREGPKPTTVTTVSADTTSVAMPSASPQIPSVLPAEPVAASQGTSGTKPKAQTELVKQKMEKLKRETQAKTAGSVSEVPTEPVAIGREIGSELIMNVPFVESLMNSPADGISAFESQPSMPSLIPGLFMSSNEPSAFDEIARSAIEASLSSTEGNRQAKTAENETPVGLSNFQPLSPSTVPAKRPSNTDSAMMGIPLPKKPNTQQNLPYTPSRPLPDVEADYQSEGEIFEEPESDAMAMGTDSEQDVQEDDAAPVLNSSAAASVLNKPTPVNQTPTIALRKASTGDSGKDELYRAKQSEIEAMRRKIAELEQRNKLKRTRSQVESPSSSNPPTPAVTKEDQQLTSSPVPHTVELPSVSRPVTQRQPVGPTVPPVISKLSPAQLQEREAALKQALLRQRAQRQQVLQEGLPDLNAKVKKTETRLEDVRQELAQVRAQIQTTHLELDRLGLQEKRLVEEISKFEEQLQEGRSGQKRYSDELQQIRLEKLAEAQAAPTKEQSIAGPDPSHPATDSISESQLDLSNGHLDNREETMETQQGSLSMPADTVAAKETVDAEVDASMDREDMHGALRGKTEPAQSIGIANPAQQIQADDMEISPEPEDYVETHEHLPENVETMQPSDDAMDVDSDSNGSASMSGSDDEEEYQPTAIDTSQPMQQSEDESEEYDPETAPVDSVTPTTVPEDGLQDFHETSGTAAASRPDTDAGTPVDRARDVSGAIESDTSYVDADVGVNGVAAVSEVPANTKDDLESVDQLTDADTLVRPPPGSSRDTDAVPFLHGTCAPPAHYVPYKTPLSAFKSYRFHSDYPDTVKTGYRSLTYSNNIDPSRPLCPTELSGQICTDHSCEEQHFAQLGLPDETILVQMSSASGIKDKSTRDAFHAGLKLVIAGLRANEVRDFEKVAHTLSEYRRQFFAEREEKERQEDDDSQKQVQQEHREHQEQEAEAVDS